MKKYLLLLFLIVTTGCTNATEKEAEDSTTFAEPTTISNEQTSEEIKLDGLTILENPKAAINEKISETAKTVDSLKNCYKVEIHNGNVYFNNQIIEDADAKTFEKVADENNIIFKDKENNYMINFPNGCGIRPPSFYIYKNTDPESFESIHMHQYTRDKNQVFFCNGCATASTIENANPATFTVLEWPYAKDDKAVYYQNNLFPAADPATFESIENGRFQDKNNTYDRFRQIVE
jgi:DKNYY family